MPLVYLPDAEALFLWGEKPTPPALSIFEGDAIRIAAPILTPHGVRDSAGLKLPLLGAATHLAVIPMAELEALPGSVATWVLASKLAFDLVARERVVPTLHHRAGRVEARWSAALAGSDDASKLTALARSMPASAHAVPAGSAAALEVWTPDALLRAYLDAVVDAFIRSARGAPELLPASARGAKSRQVDAQAPAWGERWRDALTGPEREFRTQGFRERSVHEDLTRWSAPALGARDRLRACFRLELPQTERAPFVVRFLLQSPDDPSLLVLASDVWATRGRSLEKLGRAFRDPQESLLEALGRASRLFAPLRAALEEAQPERLLLDPAAAWTFLGEGAAALAEAGFGVIVPGELTAAGQRRLRLRMRVGEAPTAKKAVAGAVAGASGLDLESLLTVDWEAAIGDRKLTARELEALAKRKSPLVRHRGAWVVVDPGELGEIQRRLAGGSTRIPMRQALQAVLAGETRQGDLPVAVVASGGVAEALARLQTASSTAVDAPCALRARLRPYQQRGLSWLVTIGALGLGACLADDMGLGKTIQLLAYLLRRLEDAPRDDRPALLVAPTSVVGNWEREIERFAPTLRLVRHFGPDRAHTAEAVPTQPGTLVLTTYGLLRRDAELLSQVDWSVVALDEAQNIKNAASATARAACGLRARHRFALTGTPVENRLAELWSILSFVNPGLLGPLSTFRSEFALPIERYGNDEAAARLRRIVSPFVLRRLKSDPTVIADLPAKNEMSVFCTLTREQATLYKAAVDEELRRIDLADGIERRGRVLALLSFTKQICNHPAQYLGEIGPLEGRSGKLARLTEMLEEAVLAGDKALVFTQFREMGDKLVRHLAASLGVEVIFLHGGTPKKARDEMVRRFQEDPRGPRVFVLSLKAGGTGLNLTAASHVFHFDRWWNPAVEDQATDRAYRIGQTRAVQVHKLVCAGTVEEKIGRLLAQKRELASKVVGTGEQWITELDGGALRELFALSEGALALTEGERDDRAETKPARSPAKRSARKRAVATS